NAGARHILVVNVPDLGLTPSGLASGMGPALTQLMAAYNDELARARQPLEDADVSTLRVNAFATLQDMVNSPSQFGFTNVTQPLLTTGGTSAEFLFWDSVHPTTRGHEVLEQAALHQIVDYYFPSLGKAAPPPQIGALRGLV